MKKKFYAVKRGRVPGIYQTWDECKKQVDKFPNPSYKGFATKAEALDFINSDAPPPVVNKKVVVPPKNINNNTKTEESGDQISIYCDGACKKKGNGKEGSIAGVGVWFGAESDLNLSEPLPGPKQTNQRAELSAAIRSIEQTNDKLGITQAIKLCTDSSYTISCATQWIHKWKKNGFRSTDGKEVVNRDLVERLNQLLSRPGKVTWQFVKGHSGDIGNENADALAVAGCKQAILNKKSSVLSSISTSSTSSTSTTSTTSTSFNSSTTSTTSKISTYFKPKQQIPQVIDFIDLSDDDDFKIQGVTNTNIDDTTKVEGEKDSEKHKGIKRKQDEIE